MKRILLPLFTFFVIINSYISLYSQPNTGNFTMQYTDRGITSFIYYWVPTDYDSTKKYPFLLAWHGAGDTGENNRNFFAYLLAQRINAILVCPDANNINGQDGTYFMNLTTASYNYTRATYKIDTSKIIVMGFSWGGAFAYQLGLSNPDMFRGIIGLAPAIGSFDQTMWSNIKKLRMATILGDQDFNYNVVNSLMNRIKDSSAALLYLIKPGVQHVDNTYFNSQEIIVDLRQCYDYVILKENSPLISLSRSEINFDSTFIGNQKTISFDISNSGSADLIVSNIEIINDQDTVYSINGILDNITISPGSLKTFDVVFKPKSDIIYSGHISISSNDIDNPTMTLNLNGTGCSLRVLIESSDTILNYGSVLVDETRNLDFRIYNTGNQTLNLSSINIENIPDNVIISPSIDFPIVINPAEYHTFSFGFSPKDTISYQGRIKITSNATNTPVLFINISGKGYKLRAIIESSDSVINLGNVKTNETKNLDLRIYNKGDLICNISAITLENILEDVIVFPALDFPININPNDYFTFSFEFSPKDTIIYQGRIKISSNATNFPDLYINISGRGIDPTFVNDISIENKLTINIIPNPVETHSLINVNYKGDKPAGLILKLVNIEGNFIKEFFNKTITSGEVNIELNTNDLVTGVYFIIAKIDDKTIQLPIIKNR
ncbi:MAG: choice-of-anchor D domain-containing protein [Ignavibacteriae bacterium]|nr:choice-of-anchor D domain-containing protein [Ignavibacteriota bacterium]